MLSVLLLMQLEGMAIFFNGGYFTGMMTACAIWAWLLVSLVAWTRTRDIFLQPRAGVIAPVIALGAFWLWNGLSQFWSVAPDLSWTEFNRTGGYLAVFVLGAFTARHRLSRNLAAWLFLAAASAGAFYSLGVKALPTVVDNLDNVIRVSVPLGSVNGLGLLAAFTFPLALYLSSSRKFFWLLRLLAMLTAPLLLICLFYTLSRGATLALVIGLIAYFSFSPLRLRSFGSFLLALAPTLAIAWWSTRQAALSNDHVALPSRAAAAAHLRIYLILAFLTVGLIYGIALFIGKRIKFPRQISRITGAISLIAVLAALFVGSSLFISSKPSFTQWAIDSYHNFTLPGSSKGDVNRLFELGRSGDRWQLWQESVSDWQKHLITGSGAETFPIIHLTLRTSSRLYVKQPHGLAFRVLAELGLVGFMLIGAFISLTMFFGTLNFCRLKHRWERGMMVTFLAMAITYLVHTSYDWDWNMFALTLPYFFFSGILVGWRPGGKR